MKTVKNLLNWKNSVLFCIGLLCSQFANGQVIATFWNALSGQATTTTNGEAKIEQYVQIGDIGSYAGVNGWKNPSLWIKSLHMNGEAQNDNQVSLDIDNWQDYAALNSNNIVEIKRRDVSGSNPIDYSFLIRGNGKVTMGVDPATTNLNGNFKLFVKGGILTDKVEVKVSNAWPDYVFSDNYKLASLEETEAYIKAYQHLPGVPSAAEIKENGLNLGDMDATLLQKIEELTLHMIDLKKENEALRIRIEQLEK